MKKQDQVCSYEQAVKLAQLGIKQSSYFGIAAENDGTVISRDKSVRELQLLAVATDIYAAFTVAELGKMLSEWITEGHKDFRFFQWHYEYPKYPREKFIARYKFRGGENEDGLREYIGQDIEGSTEAQARAALLICVLENNYFTAEQINARMV